MSAVLASLHGADAAPRRAPRAHEAARLDCFVCRLRLAWQDADPYRRGQGVQPWLVSGRRSVRRGDVLHHAGEPARHVWSVHTGQFKTCSATPDGRSQVTGFHVPGDLLGIDAVGRGVLACDAVALEDAQVCQIGLAEMLQMLGATPTLQHELWRRMGEQIARDHEAMLWLRSHRAEERVAGFVLSLLDRLHRLGASSSATVLRMTRAEIGSYLGVTLETVSRAFSHFRALGLLDVHERDIRVLDRAGLQALCNAG